MFTALKLCELKTAGFHVWVDAAMLAFTLLMGAGWAGVKLGRWLEWIDPVHTAEERYGVRHPRAGRFWV